MEKWPKICLFDMEWPQSAVLDLFGFEICHMLFVGVFRECGGTRCIHNMVPYRACRQQALNIVQQLVLSSGGDEDLATLLGLMHTSPSTALELNTHILKVFMNLYYSYYFL